MKKYIILHQIYNAENLHWNDTFLFLIVMLSVF